jgi:UV DNA damage repair endonuclease
MTGRVGFCCKWIDNEAQIDGFRPDDAAKELNTRVTTVAWLNRQTQDVAEQRLWDLMVHNISSIHKLIDRVGDLDERRRMVRLGSDILPVYTEPTWSYFWRRADVRRYAESALAKVGALARSKDVRLSFHPGQFVVLASDNPDIVARSIEEFEYHADLIRWMGYGQTFQDFKCNVHIAGKQGPAGIIAALQRLSPEARNTITIENDEMRWGIEESLMLVNHCALVLDIHHHWIRTGEYIEPDDVRVDIIKDSWRGVRPALHYSVSREDYIPDHDVNVRPDMFLLLDQGFKKSKLRAHSDFYWNNAVNSWAESFSTDFDIQCESKAKNLARDRFINSWKP